MTKDFEGQMSSSILAEGGLNGLYFLSTLLPVLRECIGCFDSRKSFLLCYAKTVDQENSSNSLFPRDVNV